ncbi:nucleoside hydrolase [Opitutus terrae]|uniref:Inosine/uridine-preferring nucleoside hydrolase n=1 Tax=Opitutus terrae (strain DSM 11246 / JCM 15787 / PB90-1) TaxID=452637 RepID=B1ZWJ4_OPITP|nr:nucleoside hydrolase [Opitutus terrae]ACB73318.1 Inosine/uridine-preferring nucleoside hydrolase [Opitutus terrae PB90-1]
MRRFPFIRVIACAILLTSWLSPVFAAPPAGAKLPIPVVFHTDIGTDIDDTWALAQLLRSPELDLKLVLVDTNDTRYRAKVAARLLEIAGRTDVPIGLGVASPMREQEQNQLPWVRDYDLTAYRGRVLDDGVGALIELVMNSPEPVSVVSVGAVPALARAIEREPKLASRARFVGMHGSVDIGYGGGPVVAEANVKVDPAALRAVLAAPWQDVLLTPLDTCGNVDLDGANYHAVWCATADPLLRAVIEGYCVFAPRVTWMKCDFFTQRSTTLFDCVAVYLAYSEDLVETETVRIKVTDDGFTVRDPAGPSARVALRWKDHAGFESHLAHRLLQQR